MAVPELWGRGAGGQAQNAQCSASGVLAILRLSINYRGGCSVATASISIRVSGDASDAMPVPARAGFVMKSLVPVCCFATGIVGMIVRGEGRGVNQAVVCQ